LLAAINSTLADCLHGFDVRPEVPVHACVNVAEYRKGWQAVCGQIWTQEDGQETATSPPYEYPGAELDDSREPTALCGVAGAGALRYALEMSDDPSHLRPGERVIVGPRILGKLSTVLQDGNVGHDQVDSRWHTELRILSQSQTWPPNCRPVSIGKDDPEIGQTPDLALKGSEWMDDANHGRYRIRGRHRVNGYVCGMLQPSLNR
jgi:hypothetical protein